jgi:hypothetical protein
MGISIVVQNWSNALFALVIYFTVNTIMVTFSPAYRRLPGGERFQCCVHCVFMFVFALQFIPYSYVMAKLLFGPDFQVSGPSSDAKWDLHGVGSWLGAGGPVLCIGNLNCMLCKPAWPSALLCYSRLPGRPCMR